MSHVQAGAERKKYISATNSHLIATEQLLNTFALRYAHVLIKRVSFVDLVVVTKERTEELRTIQHKSRIKLQGAERRFRGEKECISKPHKLRAREAQQNTTTKETPRCFNSKMSIIYHGIKRAPKMGYLAMQKKLLIHPLFF